MPDFELRIRALYPESMNIYADRGNIRFLVERCRRRDIAVKVGAATIGDALNPGEDDLIYMGGGQDRDQARVAEDLVSTKRNALCEATEMGVVLLAVCGGYQLLGSSYRLGDSAIEGLGLLDLETRRESGPRLIGNIAIKTDIGDGSRVLAGFENHGGRTYLGTDLNPLGRVISGHGNNGKDGGEGATRGTIFGTYLHGPLLPKNAWFADHLIATILERKHGRRPTLTPLDDTLENAVHADAVRAAARR